MKGLIARKVGMTQIFDEKGIAVPVTVLDTGSNIVAGLRTVEKDGYSAIRLGFGEVKEKRLNKPLAGVFKKAKVQPRAQIREVRGEFEGVEAGKELGADVFNAGDIVAISGVSKGKGFSGLVRRHNFSRGPVSHGSHNIRQPGSIGSVDAARTFRGLPMAGQLGNQRATVRTLRVVKVDAEKNLLMVEGAVPGPKNGLVVVREQTSASGNKP